MGKFTDITLLHLNIGRYEISTWKNQFDWAKVYIIWDCQQYKRDLYSNGFRFKRKLNLKNVENKKLGLVHIFNVINYQNFFGMTVPHHKCKF